MSPWQPPPRTTRTRLPALSSTSGGLAPSGLPAPHTPHTLCDHAFQVQNVWVVELAHDCCLSKEVPPLAIRRCVLQGLNGHSLAVLARDPQVPSIHFPKLPWVERTQGHGPMHGQPPASRRQAAISSSPPVLFFFSGPEAWHAPSGNRSALMQPVQHCLQGRHGSRLTVGTQ